MKTTMPALAAILLVTVFGLRGPSELRVVSPESKTITVLVRTTGPPFEAVSGARVIVLARDGRELGVATTEKLGTAFVKYTPGDGKPMFVLVEAMDFYISGLRWEEDAEEYFILVARRAAH